MEKLMLNNTEIHSLEELREQFNLEELTARFLDGTLETWMADCFYDDIASRLQSMDHEDTALVRQQLCEALGVNYYLNADFTPEERAKLDRKLDLMREYTDREAVLVHVVETATNQVELAEYLAEHRKTIYLCGGPFAVPIQMTDIHYIGIGNPKVKGPYSEAQYKRVGITFEGVELPREERAEMRDVAADVARKYGYDPFKETHCRLATLFHYRMKNSMLTRYYTLNEIEDKTCGEVYKSKARAEFEAKDVISRAYDLANRYFQAGSSDCIALPLAEQYAGYVERSVSGIAAKLAEHVGPGKDALLSRLCELVSNAKEGLCKRFESELRDSADYYAMYKKDYFLERFELTEMGGDTEMFDSELANMLLDLFVSDREYMVAVYPAINELRDDVADHAAAFFAQAYELYKDYCAEIEEIAEEIGKDLPDDGLVELGFVNAAQLAS